MEHHRPTKNKQKKNSASTRNPFSAARYAIYYFFLVFGQKRVRATHPSNGAGVDCAETQSSGEKWWVAPARPMALLCYIYMLYIYMYIVYKGQYAVANIWSARARESELNQLYLFYILFMRKQLKSAWFTGCTVEGAIGHITLDCIYLVKYRGLFNGLFDNNH